MLSCNWVPILTIWAQSLSTDPLLSPLSASLSGVEIGAERAKNQVRGSGV